jgi:hypothetical protein
MLIYFLYLNPSTFVYPDLDNLSTANIKKYKTFSMENGVEVLDFSGSIQNVGNRVAYMIFPPLGDGVFFTGSSVP